MNTFSISLRRFSCHAVLGVVMTFLLIGCAHRDGTPKVLDETSPPQAAVSDQAVESDPAIEDGEFGDEEDFFEDEFSTDAPLVADPLAPFNRLMFKFNDKLYFWGLKPIARGYRAIVPDPVRLSVGNFFYNLAGIGRMANCLFQGKLRSAGGEFGRFFVNSTAGLLGLGNPAANYPTLNPGREDLGQTLGTYGMGEGFYLVLPIFGSSTLRDAIGLAGDAFLSPFAYLDPWYIPAGIRAWRLTNQLSFRLGDYEAAKSSAIDPYILFRSGYIQKRRQMISR